MTQGPGATADSIAPTAATGSDAQPRLARQVALAVLLCAAVMIPRGLWIVHEHSTCVDDNYHIYRGLELLRGDWVNLYHVHMNDPIFGEAILAIPAWLNDVHLQDNLKVYQTDMTHPPAAANCYTLPDSVRYQTAVWKTLLLLPGIAVLFVWVAGIYGLGSAWLATAMVLVEPTLAALTPLPTPDVLGTEAILIACWAAWRFIEKTVTSRLWVAGITMGLAMAIKHTALILPAVAAVMAALAWLGHQRLWKRPDVLLANVGRACLVAIIAAMTIWAACCFDLSRPSPKSNDPPVFLQETLEQHVLPAGIYLASVFEAVSHVRTGHPGFLWGTTSWHGWWYYFPVLATYKIPIGLGAVLVMGALSLAWVRPRYQELPLLVGAAAWCTSVMLQSVDIGFRHFLPAEIFLLMLASRCVARQFRFVKILAALGIAAAAIDVLAWTPDYLNYINFPRKNVYLQISDSNLDWGQGRKIVKRWINRQKDDGTPIYFGYFGPIDVNLFDELSPRLTQYSSCSHWVRRPGSADSPDILPDTNVLPRRGLLVVSGVALTGQYDLVDRFAPLRKPGIEPDATLANYLLVYDMDRLHREGKLP